MGSERDKAEGKWDEAKGNVKEKVGEVTDDERLEGEGKVDQAKGGGKQALGKAKDAGEKAKDAVQDAFD